MRWPRSWVNHARLLCTFFFLLFGEHQDYFARLPDLRVVEYTPAPVRVYGDFAAQAGTYTFSWQGTAGDTVEMRSRFSFTFRRDNPGSAQAWTIVEHHSSNMPTSPLELELTQVSDTRTRWLAVEGVFAAIGVLRSNCSKKSCARRARCFCVCDDHLCMCIDVNPNQHNRPYRVIPPLYPTHGTCVVTSPFRDRFRQAGRAHSDLANGDAAARAEGEETDSAAVFAAAVAAAAAAAEAQEEAETEEVKEAEEEPPAAGESEGSASVSGDTVDGDFDDPPATPAEPPGTPEAAAPDGTPGTPPPTTAEDHDHPLQGNGDATDPRPASVAGSEDPVPTPLTTTDPSTETALPEETAPEAEEGSPRDGRAKSTGSTSRFGFGLFRAFASNSPAPAPAPVPAPPAAADTATAASPPLSPGTAAAEEAAAVAREEKVVGKASAGDREGGAAGAGASGEEVRLVGEAKAAAAAVAAIAAATAAATKGGAGLDPICGLGLGGATAANLEAYPVRIVVLLAEYLVCLFSWDDVDLCPPTLSRMGRVLNRTFDETLRTAPHAALRWIYVR